MEIAMNDSPYEHLLSIYSDVHKDAYGNRPRNWEYVRTMSETQLQTEINELSIIAEREADYEYACEKRAYEAWIQRMNVISQENTVSIADAVRWDMQAEDCEDDLEHYIWSLGIGCGKWMFEAKKWHAVSVYDVTEHGDFDVYMAAKMKSCY